MKVKVQKLGIIQSAEFNLKPLTIFVGPNNTGKTWLAYTLASILGTHGWYEYAQAYAGDQISKVYPPLDSAIDQLLTRGDTKINLYDFADQYGEIYFNSVANFARHWMKEFMSTQFSLFDDMDIVISLEGIKATFLERVKKASLQSSVADKLLNIRKISGDKMMYVYTSTENDEQITERIPPEVIKERLIHSLARILHQSLYSQIRVFPTERTAIVTFSFGSGRRKEKKPADYEEAKELIEVIEKAFQQLSKMNIREVIDRKTKAVIGPISYFVGMMSNIFQFGSKEIAKREEVAKSDPNIQSYLELAKVLERDILAGTVAFSTPEPDSRRDIFFQPAQNISLEIPIASSMVKELSSLVLYLRCLAQPGDLLIIDEPEMNLHPAAQVKIIEFLSMLVNAGLHVLITTHSTYVIDHLVNLMDAYKHENHEEIAKKFLLERKDAFITQDRVSVYEVTEGGEVKDILDQGAVIHWQTFGDVTEYVQRLHFEL
jgi:ribosomal protein L19E